MCSIQRRIIDFSRKFDHGSCITGNTVNCFLSCYRDIAGIVIGINEIPDSVACIVNFRTINKGDNIAFVIFCKCKRLTVCLRTIAGNRQCVFYDILSDRKIRIGYSLVLRKWIAFRILIMNRIAQCLA